MPYTIALHAPESPLNEDWAWQTDLVTSYNGSEARTPLASLPRREFSGLLEFTRAADARRHAAFMFQSQRIEFGFPLFQYQVPLKQRAAIGADNLVVNTQRSDLRVGQQAIIIEGANFQVFTVSAIAADSVTMVEVTTEAYTERAIVCPIVGAFTNPGGGMTRRNADDSARSQFRYIEARPRLPFLSPQNTTTLATFDGFPVLDRKAVGTEFEEAADNGMRATEYLSGFDFFSPYEQGHQILSRRYVANRTFDPASFLWWQKFADTVKGSAVAFLLPSDRADLEIVTPANGGGSTVTVRGTEYSEHYFAADTFKRFSIDTAAGRQYVKATGVAVIGGNDRITFSPALPAGAAWSQEQRISFARKVRIADDRINCVHYSGHAELTIAMRTVR